MLKSNGGFWIGSSSYEEILEKKIEMMSEVNDYKHSTATLEAIFILILTFAISDTIYNTFTIERCMNFTLNFKMS